MYINIKNMNIKQKAARVLFAVINTGISIFQFMLLLNLSIQAVKIYSKLKSVVALYSTVPLGMIELSFLIFIFSYYFKYHETYALIKKFLAVTAVQAFVFSLIIVIRLIVLSQAAIRLDISVFSFMRTPDYIQFFTGIAGGVMLLIISRSIVDPHVKSE